MLKGKEGLNSEIEKAVKLHGHLGPFLVIGVKTAKLAEEALKLEPEKQRDLEITATLPLFTPYSCTLDGIQAVTQCTIGNRKLKIRNSSKVAITVDFRLKSQNKALRVNVNPEILEFLKDKYSKKTSNEELASIIAFMPEKELFTMELNADSPGNFDLHRNSFANGRS